jgi:hypothetical protein
MFSKYIYTLLHISTVHMYFKHRVKSISTALFNYYVHNQRCQMAVVTATFQNFGSFKSWMAMDN